MRNLMTPKKKQQSEPTKPKILLIGTSNRQGIDEERLFAKCVTHKCTAYTFEITFEKLDSVRSNHYNAVVLHCLTNELAKESPDTCVSKLDEIVTKCGDNWPNIKIILSFGKFSCHTYNGSITVDYVIVSEPLLFEIPLFNIANFIPTISDTHSKLSWEIKSRYKILPSVNTSTDIPFPKQYIWDDTSEIKFQNALSNPHFQNQISDFIHDNIDLTRDNINNACSKCEHVITDAADSCLKRSKLKNNKRKGLSHKKWYDCDLKKNKERNWIEQELYYLFILLLITSKTVILNCVEFTTKI